MMLLHLLFPLLFLATAQASFFTSAWDKQQQPLHESSRSFDLSNDDFVERVHRTLNYWQVPGVSIAVITPDGVTSRVRTTSIYVSIHITG